jgi:hypothetical protein
MTTYRMQFSLPLIEISPNLPVSVEADNENAAIDAGFEVVFDIYRQFGGFQLDKIEVVEE